MDINRLIVSNRRVNGNGHILIVHPFLSDRRNLEALLRDSGFENQIVKTSISEGISFLLHQDPDLVVFPKFMKEGDGYGFAARARKVSSALLLLVCNQITYTELSRFLQLGIDDCVILPISRSRLRDKLSRIRTERSKK